MNRIVCLLAGAALALSAQFAPAAPPDPLDPEHVVREWAAASRGIAPPGKSAHRRLLHTYGTQHNGHQIALICEFRGPIDADQLLARYTFTAAERNGDVVRLTAVPRDAVERLFVERFEVTFTDDSRLPLSVCFDHFDGAEQEHHSITLFRRSPGVEYASDTPGGLPTASTDQLAGDEKPNKRGIQTASASSLQAERKYSGRLQELLDGWKRNASRNKNIRAEFVRFEYDHTFGIEKRTKGTLLYAVPDKGRLDLEPVEFAQSDIRRADRNGKRYQSAKTDPETLIWTGRKFYLVKHAMKEIYAFSKPQGKSEVRAATFAAGLGEAFFNLRRTYLPLLATWLPYMETDLKWTLAEETPSQFQLKGVPQTAALKAEFSEVGLVLDAGTCKVHSVRFVSPDRRYETVYVLEKVQAKIDENAVEFVDGRDFAAPDRSGYKWTEYGE